MSRSSAPDPPANGALVAARQALQEADKKYAEFKKKRTNQALFEFYQDAAIAADKVSTYSNELYWANPEQNSKRAAALSSRAARFKRYFLASLERHEAGYSGEKEHRNFKRFQMSVIDPSFPFAYDPTDRDSDIKLMFDGEPEALLHHMHNLDRVRGAAPAGFQTGVSNIRSALESDEKMEEFVQAQEIRTLSEVAAVRGMLVALQAFRENSSAWQKANGIALDRLEDESKHRELVINVLSEESNRKSNGRGGQLRASVAIVRITRVQLDTPTNPSDFMRGGARGDVEPPLRLDWAATRQSTRDRAFEADVANTATRLVAAVKQGGGRRVRDEWWKLSFVDFAHAYGAIALTRDLDRSKLPSGWIAHVDYLVSTARHNRAVFNAALAMHAQAPPVTFPGHGTFKDIVVMMREIDSLFLTGSERDSAVTHKLAAAARR